MTAESSSVAAAAAIAAPAGARNNDKVKAEENEVTMTHDNMNEAMKKTMMMKKNKASKKFYRSVNFKETVTVIPIPTKDEYSDRIKAKLWTSKYEMMKRIGKYMHVCLCFPRAHHLSFAHAYSYLFNLSHIIIKLFVDQH